MWKRRMGREILIASLLALAAVGACTPAAAVGSSDAAATSGKHLPVFHSQKELDAQLADWKRKYQAERAHQQKSMMAAGTPPAPPAPAPAAVASAPAALDSVTVTGSTVAGGDAITNVQTVGVDEGGIVKRHGDYLVVLRRGRLFSLRVGGDMLQTVSSVDAYAPGLTGSAWYDEMLISGNRVVVIGYSYARKGTEVGLFEIAEDGQLRYLDTWHLRSGDYYSSRNYASRLIGSTLVFYAPLRLSLWGAEMLEYPGVSHWRGDKVPQTFKRLLPAERIYRADAGLDPLRDGITLHTVTRCELATLPIACTATAVLGPSGREFYVSQNAVYVWTQRRSNRAADPSVASVLRLPLDGGAVSALGARGAPIDQFSFLEDAGYLNVLVQRDGRGDGMWGAETGAGRLALLRAPLSGFGGMSSAAPMSAYRLLPEVPNGNRQNRYIGHWLVYAGSAWNWNKRTTTTPQAYALGFSNAAAPILSLSPTHAVERIEALGADAVLVGNQGENLLFSSVSLTGDVLGIRDSYAMADAEQGERRSHGFFYRNDGVQEGVIGLPVTRKGESSARGFLGAPDGNAAVTYLRNHHLHWEPLGELVSTADVRDDHCKASCVDWYGNARPIFIGQRVFALMGYELVEGRMEAGRIVERRRIDFTPKQVAPTRAQQ